MDYSLLVGIHDCERPDKYGDHVYGPQDVDASFADGSPVEDESGKFKGRVQCFSMQVVINKCFLLNPEKNGADLSCRFRLVKHAHFNSEK